MRVVYMPLWELFELQKELYHEQVLPEAALDWERYVGRHGEIIVMRSFGLSAPGRRCKRISASTSLMCWQQPTANLSGMAKLFSQSSRKSCSTHWKGCN
ncbi:MAG: hypothetical protein VCA57_18870 [Pseudomonas sp.]|uniref:transketolase-like TK C-terminal-containing protein n=1 Tax=Pseudomonas sp. TaxID=306 RepID=UPI003981BF1E